MEGQPANAQVADSPLGTDSASKEAVGWVLAAIKKMPSDSEVSPIARMALGFHLILSGLGIDDLDDPHLKDTPWRAAKAWYHDLCSGLTGEPPKITTFPHEGDSGMVVLQNIPVKSMCSHHLLPFVGVATVAYISGSGRILGLSKLSRITDYWSRRPQVQELLTANIADDLFERIKGDLGVDSGTGGVGVVIKASHMCMVLRGVNHAGEMVTSQLRGVFHEPAVKAEFLKLTGEV